MMFFIEGTARIANMVLSEVLLGMGTSDDLMSYACFVSGRPNLRKQVLKE